MTKLRGLLKGLTVLSLAIVVGIYAGTAFAAPPNANVPQSTAMLKATVQSQLGNILTDNKGWALYTFANDTVGRSNCTGNCAKTWQPFIVADGVKPLADSMVAGDLGVIKRSDGQFQVTYNGIPLYYYSKDAAASDVNGDGVAGLWSAVRLRAAVTD
jgi:predicted lipoprotein with Yx(FWY)xxD motif